MGYNYTLSCCLLNNIDSNPSYLREILYYFVVHANDKIVIDDNGFILNIYGEYAKDNEQNCNLAKCNVYESKQI